MSVWFVIPSKRPLAEANDCIATWQRMGYKVAVLRESSDGVTCADFRGDVDRYIGWARSVNLLVNAAMARWSNAEWFVTGGDDYYPDPAKRAEEIARECNEYFAGRGPADRIDGNTVAMSVAQFEASRTFGVMQPTGDRWDERHGSAPIDRIAGSPWMGREFCRRMYHGSGPMYNGYHHNFADEELQNVALKLGVFWQRRDLLQEHRHYVRPKGNWNDAPQWARDTQNDFTISKALFAPRKAAGFPGHEPLEF